jgi:excisionase family DNA binding protein
MAQGLCEVKLALGNEEVYMVVERLLTIKEVCAELRVGKHTAYKWMKSTDPSERLVGFVLPGGRAYRVRRVDLDKFLDQHKIMPDHNWDIPDDEGDE